MRINEIKLRTVSSEIFNGQIHGQGKNKKYCFIVSKTSLGFGVSEVYAGIYSAKLINAALEQVVEKIQSNNRYFDSLKDIENLLHIPFISGTGIYQVVVNCFINSLYPLFSGKPITYKSARQTDYLSGGTVKSTLNDLENEVARLDELGLSHYKIRLDFRDLHGSKKKIQYLNRIHQKYCIDFISNTNFQDWSEDLILDLVKECDPMKVGWVEEPIVPDQLLIKDEFLRVLREMGFKIALGESFTSDLEVYSADQNENIDIIQIDATMTGNYAGLSLFCANSKSTLGFHNWGSVLTLLQNSYLGSNFNKVCFFELPFYTTSFDQEVSLALNFNFENRADMVIKNMESVVKIIEDFDKLDGQDFTWS